MLLHELIVEMQASYSVPHGLHADLAKFLAEAQRELKLEESEEVQLRKQARALVDATWHLRLGSSREHHLIDVTLAKLKVNLSTLPAHEIEAVEELMKQHISDLFFARAMGERIQAVVTKVLQGKMAQAHHVTLRNRDVDPENRLVFIICGGAASGKTSLQMAALDERVPGWVKFHKLTAKVGMMALQKVDDLEGEALRKALEHNEQVPAHNEQAQAHNAVSEKILHELFNHSLMARAVFSVTVVDPDEYKKSIRPENVSNAVYALVTHEESSFVASKVRDRIDSLVEKRRISDIVFDAVKPRENRFHAALKAGGHVVLYVSSCPPEEAVVRANVRGDKTGRYVPVDLLLAGHKELSQELPRVLKPGQMRLRLFDTSDASSTMERERKIIAEVERYGHTLVVLRLGAFLEFSLRAHLNPGANCKADLYPDKERHMELSVTEMLRYIGNRQEPKFDVVTRFQGHLVFSISHDSECRISDCLGLLGALEDSDDNAQHKRLLALEHEPSVDLSSERSTQYQHLQKESSVVKLLNFLEVLAKKCASMKIFDSSGQRLILRITAGKLVSQALSWLEEHEDAVQAVNFVHARFDRLLNVTTGSAEKPVPPKFNQHTVRRVETLVVRQLVKIFGADDREQGEADHRPTRRELASTFDNEN